MAFFNVYLALHSPHPENQAIYAVKSNVKNQFMINTVRVLKVDPIKAVHNHAI